MITRAIRAGATVVLILAAADPASAQPSRLQVSGGYQITRAADQTFPVGWSADIATRLDGTWSIVGEVSGANKVAEDSDLGVDVKLSQYGFGAGARWSSRVASTFVPFLQVLAGVARVSAHAEILGTRVGDSSAKFMLQPGGGVNLRLSETLGLVGQADYRRVFLDDGDGQSGESQLRILVSVRVGL